jgi:hypothetical protein
VLTNQTDLMAVLNGKQPLITAGTTAQYYRGDKTFQTLNTTAVPEGTNLYWTDARFNTGFSGKTTSNLAEGSNLYYTDARFDTRFGTKSTSNLTEGSNLYWTNARFDTRLGLKTTSDLSEGSNLYYTDARFDTRFGTKTTDNLTEGATKLYYSSSRFNADFNNKNTDNLPEGSTNLFWTPSRSRNALTLLTAGTGGLSTYNSTTGQLNIPQYQDLLVNPLVGAGSQYYVPRYSGTTSLTPGLIYDNGVYVGINRTNPFYTLDVNGTLNIEGVSIFRNLAGSGDRVVYVNSSGQVIPATIGTGLSLSSGVLTATGTASGSIGGSGTSGYVPKFTGTAAIGNSNIQDSGTLITLGSNTYVNGALGIGTTTLTGYSLNVGKNITGATTAYGVRSQGTVQSDVTTLVSNYGSLLNTAAASFTLTDFVHHRSMQGTIGSGSVVTNQYGYFSDSSMIGATNNFGFYGNIPSGTNRWNIYMGGTAKNYLNGSLLIGSTIDAGYKLDVTGTTRFIGTTASDTAPLGSELAAVTGTGTSWTLAGTNLNVGGYTHTTGDITALTTSLAAVSGTYYQITYTITGRTAGSITIAYGGTSTAGITATGATGPLASSTAVLTITPTTDFDGTIVLSIKSIGTSIASSAFANSSGTSIVEIRTTSINTNTFIGLDAGRRNTTGFNNTFFGYQAGINNTTGLLNVFFGYQAGINNTTGNFNAFFGANAGSSNTTGGSNTFIGIGGGTNNTTGSNNSFIGLNAGSSNTTGGSNTFISSSSGFSNTTGGSNTFIGVNAGQNNTTGSNNTAIGINAGRFIANGSTSNAITDNSIYIGFNSKALANNQTNQIVIGYDVTGLGSNTTVLGNSSTTLTALYGAVITGGTSINASAQLQVDSTTKGVLFPRMTTTQKNAISSPAVGLIVYDTTLNKLCVYNELESLIKNLPTLSIGTNGLVFYPKYSGVTNLHIEKKNDKVDISSNNKEVIEQKSYHIIHNFVDFLKSRSYGYESNGGKPKMLWLSRTTIPDVYDISEKEHGDKEGIALVPNLKTSHMCDNLVGEKPVKFNCIYSNKFKKWIPINVI